MNNNIPENISQFIKYRNKTKVLFTAGPASLIQENLIGLRPCFGRADDDYKKVEEFVINKLKIFSGQNNVVRLQGSASLALEIISLNFLYGRVVILSTGYYSDRLIRLIRNARNVSKEIKEILVIDYEKLDDLSGKFDWIVACYTETSRGFKISIEDVKKKSIELKSQIMLDATASIGLEPNHELADVIGFSSCKGLFGLTGAAFVAYKKSHQVDVDSFYLDLDSHIDKKMTGPYHSICSLYETLKNHNNLKFSVEENKKVFMKRFQKYINISKINQPLICTYTSCDLHASSQKVILYKVRDLIRGSIVCHLGEVHLSNKSKGKIVDLLKSI